MESIINEALHEIPQNLQEEIERTVKSADLDETVSLINGLETYSENLESLLKENEQNTTVTKLNEKTEAVPHKLTYEEQAYIVFENYIRNTNRILSGKEKRRLLRECQRNAKKGRYEYMFDEEKQRKKRERTAKAFEKMNAPTKSK